MMGSAISSTKAPFRTVPFWSMRTNSRPAPATISFNMIRTNSKAPLTTTRHYNMPITFEKAFDSEAFASI